MSYQSVFPFQLSDWQKRALQAIEDGNHCLVTAPTGSGKTVPAEYAIHYFTRLGKKVIYTSPIKALSNQKYYEFQEKFPDVSFGILTGDIKDNPEADVLIMTTEILCNHLHNLRHPESKLEFNINLHDELGCVVFDEVHYINDADRGTVWEECFMLLPQQIQLVMLSATIATPEKFSSWIESIHPSSDKKVLLCDTSLRAVPLSHYIWLTAIDSAFHTKNKKAYDTMERVCNKPVLLYNEKEGFSNTAYRDMCDAQYHLQTNHHIKRQHILNSIVKYMNENEMLPAICFVYSRKNVERFAKELTLHLNDSLMMNRVEKECRGVLSRFPNYKEYMVLDEYKTIVKLLEKGIGIHHSGLLPVFREMIEILFSKGYVKMLFATETFAVGLNMPTKTVLFTSLKKFDGNEHRYLLPHEYTQQAGRAGRRGYDTVGHVIHLCNMFEPPTETDYKIILGNVPQRIVSKLKISYSMVLNCENPEMFIRKSAIQHDIQKEVDRCVEELGKRREKIAIMEEYVQGSLRTPLSTIKKLADLEDTISYYRNKQRKAKEREMTGIYQDNRFAKEELEKWRELNSLKKEASLIEETKENAVNYVDSQVSAIRRILENNGFASDETRCLVARNIKETHPLAMADLYEKFAGCSSVELASLFSCFTNINVAEEHKRIHPVSENRNVEMLMKHAETRLDHYYSEEVRANIYSGADYNIHFDLADDVAEWCGLGDEKQCERFLVVLQQKKGIFIGEFVKAILKINAIAKELEKICEISGANDIQYVLSGISEITLKSVCTSQSLYV